MISRAASSSSSADRAAVERRLSSRSSAQCSRPRVARSSSTAKRPRASAKRTARRRVARRSVFSSRIFSFVDAMSARENVLLLEGPRRRDARGGRGAPNGSSRASASRPSLAHPRDRSRVENASGSRSRARFSSIRRSSCSTSPPAHLDDAHAGAIARELASLARDPDDPRAILVATHDARLFVERCGHALSSRLRRVDFPRTLGRGILLPGE